MNNQKKTAAFQTLLTGLGRGERQKKNTHIYKYNIYTDIDVDIDVDIHPIRLQYVTVISPVMPSEKCHFAQVAV